MISIMYFFINLVMCFLLITFFGSTLAVPLLRSRDSAFVSSSKGALIHRVRRQGPIVQPSWSLNSDISLFEDFNVRVTDEKLEETEAIRDFIQGTVDDGTYAVELDEGDFKEEQGNTSGEEISTEELAHHEPELEPVVESQTTPAPKPVPAPPSSKAAPKTPPNKPSNFFNRFKITPRNNSPISDRPFFIWLRKSFSAK